MNGRVRVTGYLRCAPDEIGTVHTALPVRIRLTRAERGCLAFEVALAAEDPCRWRVTETFADASAFAAHQARTRASAWWTATGHMARRFEITR